MKVVDSKTKTTLLLTNHYQPFSFCTARAAIRHLMTNKGRGIDATGSPLPWNRVDAKNNVTINNWHDCTIELFEEQPALRSAPNRDTGAETLWPIPTIMVCNKQFGMSSKQGSNVPLKTLYNLHKGVCAYCLEKIPFSVATKDHCFPKSRGGSNDDFNLVLACKKCNNEKDSIYPFLNIEGQEVKPKTVSQRTQLIQSMPAMRPEWAGYLHLE